MTKGREYYQGLMKRYLNNDCTPNEATELLDYIGENAANRLLLDEMSRLFHEKLANTSEASAPAWSITLREKLAAQIQPQATIVPMYKRWLPRVAAAIVIIASSAIFYLGSKKQSFTGDTTATQTAASSLRQNDVLPGGDKALLTLADGSVIVLDEAGNGNLASQGNTSINKINGQVVYNAATNGNIPAGEITYNTIATPKGGQYQVVLPDGSRVWLNAASSLRFPTAFVGNRRTVTLTGEGYFEIEKNAAMPFHVNVNNLEVAVLGTHFNVMAYDNEAAVKTTLLEGAVNIINGSTIKSLTPGQQGRVDATGNIVVAAADTEKAVAWKNGYFQFANEDIKTIMRQLTRWYDIDVVYEGAVKSRAFSGEISRNVTLSQALKILENANVKFRMDQKKIVVLY